MKHSFKYISTLILSFILYYFMLPPINLSSPMFYVFLVLVLSFYLFVSSISKIDINIFRKNNDKFKSETILSTIIFIVIGLIIGINFILSPLFQSKAYYNRIEVKEDGDFSKDVAEVNINALPLLDKDSSSKLGDRVMGGMTDLVSQFVVSNNYTQINYNNEIIRVTPLEYASFIKYFTNHKEGIPAYITVNSVNGEAELVKLEQGMKYMPSAIFGEDLDRKLRFTYPFEIFEEENFEIDNEGNPYWIVPTIKYSGVGLRKEVSGVIILNAITGESKKYNVGEVPTWVDHVYNADLLIEQLNDWGLYENGFFNSIFSQKNVVMTTEGYNYTVMNDDVYLYTGITSVASDESNIGFVLCNLRTKETNFYAVSGAEEYSAMDSALGQVQQMNYSSTFPLLINLKGKPTYLMSLKDNAGLVKMYALVDVEDYQKVTVTDSSLGIEKAITNYLGDETYTTSELLTKDITITEIKEVVIEANTYYYFKDIDGNKYRAKVTVNKDILPFTNIGDTLNVTYELKEISEITKIN